MIIITLLYVFNVYILVYICYNNCPLHVYNVYINNLVYICLFLRVVRLPLIWAVFLVYTSASLL